ncbi:Cytochrome P450 CYP12A2, partial [Trachymyrmex septentrionalis]
SQGKLWHDFRSKVNPHMMQPQMNQGTRVKLRDPESLELPSVLTNELLKWTLDNTFDRAVGIDVGVECLMPNLAAAPEPRIMINCMHVPLMEIQMSLWKIYNTRNLKKFFSCAEYALNGGLLFTKCETMNNSTNLRDCSILEKLLHIDKVTAQVMTLDMANVYSILIRNVFGSLLYYIANNPKEKLREEIMSVLPDKTSPDTQNVLNQKRYAKACIKKSLRLFPIAVAILRTM